MRPLTRTLARHRGLIAASLTALATACALTVLAPAPPPTVPILTAARDLPSGELKPGDLTMRPFPPDAVPDGALRSPDRATGRILASPLRRGEPITDIRLLAPSLLTAYGQETVATPVRISDPDAAALLSPGDTINVLSAPTEWEGTPTAPTPAETIAEDITVITAPTPPSTDFTKPQTGALVILATTPAQAARLATAQATSHLSITINPHT